MSIAEKLIEIAEGMQEVYDAGKRAGQGQGGDDSRFWEVFQNGGEPMNYRYAFIYDRFTDETYNPKHPIQCDNTSSASQFMFYSCGLTSTKVEIVLGTGTATQIFDKASKLKTIVLLTVKEETKFTSAFGGCTSLENLTIGGTIGQNIDLSPCPLTHDSLMSVIEHLGTVSATRTLTFGTANLAKLTDAEKAIATQKGWELA